MRKFPIYLTAAAALLTGFTACSDSDDVTGGNTAGNGATSYIAVNIVNPESSPAGAKANGFTRADGFVNGSDDEGKISNVRFYFFNSDGSPFLLNNSNPANVNWLSYNVDGTTELNNDPTTVERITNAILVINGVTGSTPTYMVAVANPNVIQKADSTSTLPNNLLGTGALSRNALTAITMQSRTYNGTDGFLMTNSVYGQGGTFRLATETENHVDSTAAGALRNPVEIYVERLAAKVSVQHGNDANWTTINGRSAYPVGKTVATPGSTDSIQVYAVVKGVGLADEQHFGKIFKDIDGFSVGDATAGGQSTSDLLGINPWNSADYHRCYWEVTPAFNALADNPLNYNFNHFTSDFYTGTGNTGVFYTMPNTPTATQTNDEVNRSSDPTYRTKVLLATQLMYDNNGTWTPAEICKYRGVEYLGQNDVKTVIANQLKGLMCKKEGNTFRDIEPSDIQFITTSSNEYKSYEVIPDFADRNGDFAPIGTDSARNVLAAGGNVNTYHPNASDAPVMSDPLDAIFYRYANKAEIRNDGDAYYYTTIRHLANNVAKLGYWGVVRNHWYQVTVNSLKGFGTPVFDANKTIVPITPSDQNSYMAAQINVLQWRVVANDYNIDGTSKN